MGGTLENNHTHSHPLQLHMTQWRRPDFHALCPLFFGISPPGIHVDLCTRIDAFALIARLFAGFPLVFRGKLLALGSFEERLQVRRGPSAIQPTDAPLSVLTCRESCHAGSRSDHSIWLTRIQEGRSSYLTVRKKKKRKITSFFSLLPPPLKLSGRLAI